MPSIPLNLFRQFLLTLACLCAFAVVAAPSPVAERDGIREYRLANGLRIVLAPDPAQQNVHFNLVVLAGALADPEGKGGTAHLLEHLAFKGTQRRSGTQLVDGLRERGIAFNASTGYDRTRYTAVLDGDPAKLDWLLELEAERMAGLRLEQAALDAERSVVLREMEQALDNPFQALTHAMLAAGTPGLGLGRHVLGTREELEAIGLDDLRGFHAAHYRPDNAVLVLAGGFDAAAALAAAQRHFDILPAPQGAAPASRAALALPDAPALGEVRRGNTELLALAYPLPPARDPANVALAALADIFAGEPHGRLHQALVQPGQAQGVLALQQGFAQGGFYLFGAVAPPGQPPQALLALLAGSLESLAQRPLTEEELRRAQSGSRALQDRLRRDPAALADLLSEGAGLGDWQLHLRRFEQFAALQLPAVQRAAEQVLVADRRLAGALLAGTSAAPAAVVTPAAGRARAPATEAAGELPEAVDVRAFNQQIEALERGIQRSRLDNGLQIALRPQPGSGKPAQGMLVLRFGDVDSLHGQRALADLTGTVLIRGTRQSSYQQIVDRARALGAGLSVVPQGQSVTVRFEAPPQNLPAVLDLVAEVLQKPAFDQAEIDQVKRGWQQALSRPVDQPAAVANLQMRRLVQPFPADDIRSQLEPTELATGAAAITREEIVRFHERFYGAGDGALALVGDIDAPAVLRQVQALFGAWSGQVAFVRAERGHQDVTPARVHGRANAPQSGHYIGRLHFAIDGQSPDAAALFIVEHVLGRHPVASRLGQRLREAEGLSYGVRSSIRVARHDDAGRIAVEGSYPAGQGARLADIVKEEVARLAQQGITARELERARRTILQERQRALGQDATVLSLLPGQLQDGVTMREWAERNEAFAQVTLEQVNAVARRYLEAGRLAEVLADGGVN